MKRPAAGGNALFLILIAVALFAALSYAITQSGRGGGTIAKEQAKLDAAVAQDCTARIDQAVMRLKITGGCTENEISYENNGNNVNADAPEDKHCHVFDPAGAGETACGLYGCTGDELGDLSAGERSSCGIVYVSNSLGYRLYTTLTDQGLYKWNDANTACSGLGEGWHLPSLDEDNELYLARHAGALNGTFDETGYSYWSSQTSNDDGAWLQIFGGEYDGQQTATWQGWAQMTRCVRS